MEQSNGIYRGSLMQERTIKTTDFGTISRSTDMNLFAPSGLPGSRGKASGCYMLPQEQVRM